MMRMPIAEVRRRLPFGVEALPEGGAHARVWAPRHKRVDVVLADDSVRWRLDREMGGCHSAFIPALRPDDTYWFALDGGPLRPDPCSRFQPEGPHGPSQLIDPTTFHWTDTTWRGVEREGQILY